MASRLDFRTLPRCGAKARSNNNNMCRQAAMQNGRCHWHGGASPIKHGRYSIKTLLCNEELELELLYGRTSLAYLNTYHSQT